MTGSGFFIIFVFFSTILALVKWQKNPGLIFAVALTLLYAVGVVSTGDVFSSFSNNGLITLVLLLVSSTAIEKTRLLRMVASRIIRPSFNQTCLRFFGVTIGASAILNNTAVVSTLISPIRNNPYHAPSKLLLPLSYAAILGGTLTLIGTSTNLIVNSLLIEAKMPALHFFDFTLVGLLLVISCGAMMAWRARHLPDHRLKDEEVKSYFIDAKVDNASTLIGKSVEANGLRHLASLFLVEVIREGNLISPVSPTEIIRGGDRLIFTGDVTKLLQLQQFNGLTLFADNNGLPLENLTEVVLRPESDLVGKTLKSVGFRAKFDAAVVAIRRDGGRASGKLGEVILEAGDFLVLAVGNDFNHRNNIRKNFILVSGVEPDGMLTGIREWAVVGGFLLAVLCSALGVVSLFKAMFLYLAALMFTRCLTVNDVLRRLPLDLWLIIGTALVLSKALMSSGIMSMINMLFDNHLQGVSPWWSLLVVYILTWLLTELVTNNAAAAMMFPLSYAIAQGMGVSAMPFIMIVAYGASASFISPYGYQTNLMVYNAGQYQLKDFIKIGLPVALVYGLVSVLTVPLVFPF